MVAKGVSFVPHIQNERVEKLSIVHRQNNNNLEKKWLNMKSPWTLLPF